MKYTAFLKVTGEWDAPCYETFVGYWDQMCPDIGIRKLKKDCCNVCTTFRNKISSGASKEVLKELRQEWGDHYVEALMRRSVYRDDTLIRNEILEERMS